MKGDLPPAAFRLSTTLPVRTHEARERTGNGRGNRYEGKLAVKVGNEVFESKRQAKTKLGIGLGTLDKMIDRGEAEIV